MNCETSSKAENGPNTGLPRIWHEPRDQHQSKERPTYHGLTCLGDVLKRGRRKPSKQRNLPKGGLGAVGDIVKRGVTRADIKRRGLRAKPTRHAGAWRGEVGATGGRPGHRAGIKPHCRERAGGEHKCGRRRRSAIAPAVSTGEVEQTR
jgi:hypothetical protein